MATRKKIPLIPTDSTLTIGAAKTLSTSVNVDVSGADVTIVGSGANVVTFPSRSLTVDNITTSTTTNGTGFVKGNGSVISFDNSTYLTSVGTGVANEITYWSGTNTLGSLATATYPSLTELSYVKGVTSAIQTQLGAKISNSLVDAKGDLIVASAADTPARLAVGSDGQVPRANSAATNGIDWTPPYNSLAYQCLINAGFTVNQRVYVSNATLAAGVYGHDRWKAGASGGDYTFTQLAQATQITIKAGKSLIQVIEDKNVIGGTYTLSWTGTAQARFGINSATPSGAYAASPITITTQTAGTVMSVEFNEGTLGQVNLANSSVALPFMPKSYEEEIRACERYCEIVGGGQVVGFVIGTTDFGCHGPFRVPKRTNNPVITLLRTNPVIQIDGVGTSTGSGSTFANYGSSSSKYGFNGDISGFTGLSTSKLGTSAEETLFLVTNEL